MSLWRLLAGPPPEVNLGSILGGRRSSSRETCASCRFAGERASPSGPALECRRRAPAHYPDVYGGSRWPAVGPDHFCGEFASRGASPA